MAYASVDQLQRVLASTVFHYTQHPKKASGRALGTLVEIIIFYVLKSWGFENSVVIERYLAEYGNPDITHNVEYSLHPIVFIKYGAVVNIESLWGVKIGYVNENGTAVAKSVRKDPCRRGAAIISSNV